MSLSRLTWVKLVRLLVLLFLQICIPKAMALTSRVELREEVSLSKAKAATNDAKERHPISEVNSMRAFPMNQTHNGNHQLIGSSAPDCGHTCGACTPCTIRIDSSGCSSEFGSHAEGCPLSYSCICHGRSFPIP